MAFQSKCTIVAPLFPGVLFSPTVFFRRRWEEEEGRWGAVKARIAAGEPPQMGRENLEIPD